MIVRNSTKKKKPETYRSRTLHRNIEQRRETKRKRGGGEREKMSENSTIVIIMVQ